jgi:hypothetical protein
MNYASKHTSGCRILEYTHKNSKFVSLENDILKLVIWVDKGTDIVEIRHKKSDVDVMWRSPVGIRDITRQIPTCATARGNNNDYYPGGWHEALPGGGAYAEGGNMQGIHGEATLMPWSFGVIEDTEQSITAEFYCELVRVPIGVTKRISLAKGSGSVQFEERLVNLSRENVSLMWGHHPTYGSPLLGSAAELTIPAKTFHTVKNSPLMASPYTLSRFEEDTTYSWPKDMGKEGKTADLSVFPPGETASAEMLYLEMNEGWYALTNREINLGVGIAFDLSVFRCMWYWMNLNGLSGYPWYGSSYNVGLEFWTSWPNYEGAKKSGTLLQIPAESEVDTSYSFCIFEPDGRQVSGINKAGPVYQPHQ